MLRHRLSVAPVLVSGGGMVQVARPFRSAAVMSLPQRLSVVPSELLVVPAEAADVHDP